MNKNNKPFKLLIALLLSCVLLINLNYTIYAADASGVTNFKDANIINFNYDGKILFDSQDWDKIYELVTTDDVKLKERINDDIQIYYKYDGNYITIKETGENLDGSKGALGRINKFYNLNISDTTIISNETGEEMKLTTATPANLAYGKKAWVGDHKIVGTGSDVADAVGRKIFDTIMNELQGPIADNGGYLNADMSVKEDDGSIYPIYSDSDLSSTCIAQGHTHNINSNLCANHDGETDETTTFSFANITRKFKYKIWDCDFKTNTWAPKSCIGDFNGATIEIKSVEDLFSKDNI